MNVISFNTYLFSHRFALKRRWIVWSSNWDLFVRYADIICPTLVVLSGNRHNSTEWPNPSKYETNLPHCDVFPLRSNPSKTTKAPLDLLFALKGVQLSLISILMDLSGNLQERFNLKFNDLLLTKKSSKFLKSNDFEVTSSVLCST